MVTIKGNYAGELHCTAVHGPSGVELATDAPTDNLGRGEAFSPTDLVATALATCAVTTMGIVGQKQGIVVPPLRWQVTKEMTATPPRRIARLETTIWIPVSRESLPAELLERAAEGCPVRRSLGSEVDCPITFHWDAAAF